MDQPDINVDALIEAIIEFCMKNFDTPREAAAFLEDFFDMKTEWERIFEKHGVSVDGLV
jgi:hypothetical protein